MGLIAAVIGILVSLYALPWWLFWPVILVGVFVTITMALVQVG